jgi:hypothetical protein
MMDDKTYYWRRLDEKNSWLSYCDAMRNDSLQNAKMLLLRLQTLAPEHPRIKILQDIYDNRNDNKK